MQCIKNANILALKNSCQIDCEVSHTGIFSETGQQVWQKTIYQLAPFLIEIFVKSKASDNMQCCETRSNSLYFFDNFMLLDGVPDKYIGIEAAIQKHFGVACSFRGIDISG